MTRTDGRSGLMKVKSIADLLRASGLPGTGGNVPENPVTTASPRFRLGDRSPGWAPALPEYKRHSRNSGNNRLIILNKISLRRWRRAANTACEFFRKAQRRRSFRAMRDWIGRIFLKY